MPAEAEASKTSPRLIQTTILLTAILTTNPDFEPQHTEFCAVRVLRTLIVSNARLRHESRAIRAFVLKQQREPGALPEAGGFGLSEVLPFLLSGQDLLCLSPVFSPGLRLRR